MLTMYTAVNKDFLALDSKIDRGGIFSWETDESWASIPKKGAWLFMCINYFTKLHKL